MTTPGRKAVIGALIGLGLILCFAEAGGSWLGLGRAKEKSRQGPPVIALGRYLPQYDVSVLDETRVKAPAPITYAAARNLDLQRSALIRTVLRSRTLILRSRGPAMERRPFLKLVRSMGWRLLAEVPGRAMVFGAVARPWEANVRFHPLAPEMFRSFHRPGWAKIVWTLEVDPAGSSRSVFRTQTRVATTDGTARKRFRQYWAQFSPGIVIIRKEALRLVKGDAERRAKEMEREEKEARRGGK